MKFSLESTLSKGNGPHTARINAKDTNALVLQFFAQPFGEHGACGIGLRIGGPWVIGFSILRRVSNLNVSVHKGNTASTSWTYTEPNIFEVDEALSHGSTRRHDNGGSWASSIDFRQKELRKEKV